jgi:hypothetical protein
MQAAKEGHPYLHEDRGTTVVSVSQDNIADERQA